VGLGGGVAVGVGEVAAGVGGGEGCSVEEGGGGMGCESITDRMVWWYSDMSCSEIGVVSGRMYGMSGQRGMSSGCGSLPYCDSNYARKSTSSGSSGGRSMAMSA